MSGDPSCPFTILDSRVRLAVRVTPRAGRSRLAGVVQGSDGRSALAVRLAAAPVEGAANETLCKFIAAELGIARSRVTIRSGAASRLKQLELEGDVEAIAKRLRSLLQA
jgi:uncharacterized protein YggU (UPF0235/DUF167 family)